MSITKDALKDALEYSPDTGQFIWRAGRGRAKKGDQAGCLAKNRRGYSWVQIRIFGHLHSAHRLAWLYHFGEFPQGEIDHVNQDATDNRIENLKVVDHQGNALNQPMKASNTSGVTGVYWEERTGKWRAEVKVSGVKNRLGRFNSLEDAASAVSSFRANNGFAPTHGVVKRYGSA